MRKHVFYIHFIILILLMSTACNANPRVINLNTLLTTTDTLKTGNFNIVWNGSEEQLTISHTANPSKTLWQTVKENGFIAAAETEYTFEESRGSFTLEQEISDITSLQEVLGFQKNGNKIELLSSIASDNHTLNATLTFESYADNQLSFCLSFDDPLYNRGYLQYASDVDEAFFGFGEQCSFFNHKGNVVPILVNEQGIGRGDIEDPLISLFLGASTGDEYTSYKVAPQYISSNLNSLFLENYEYSIFDLSADDKVEIECFSSEMKGRILYGEDPAALIEEYTAYCGLMRKLPDWILEGAILGMQGGTDKVYRVWNDLKEENTPLAAFWLQDWEGQRTSILGKQLWWNWELDNQRYPNWNKMVDSLAQEDISVMGYINPFIVSVFQQKENYRRHQFKEAKENGFLALDKNDNAYLVANTSFSSGILDLSAPGCEEWLKNIIKDELIARGMKGWMADFGEALPFDSKIDYPEGTEVYHNKYPEEWERINREAITEVGLGDEIVFFSRSGYTRSPKYCTLFWMGDQLVDWGPNDGIKAACTGLLSSGISGMSFNHSDIGGYTNISLPINFIRKYERSEELLRRWTEMNAFSVVFRTHEGIGPESNAQVYDNAASVKHFSKWAKVYKAWSFYRKELVKEASLNGLPVVRHPFIHYAADENVYDLKYQFMIGDQFMIAPVLDPGTSSVNIYLPMGDWVNLWTENEINSTGSNYTITGLEEYPAVFYKKGSSVAAEFKQNLSNLGVTF